MVVLSTAWGRSSAFGFHQAGVIVLCPVPTVCMLISKNVVAEYE